MALVIAFHMLEATKIQKKKKIAIQMEVLGIPINQHPTTLVYLIVVMFKLILT